MGNSNNVTSDGFKALGKILQQTEDEINKKLFFFPNFKSKSENGINGQDNHANDLQDLNDEPKNNEAFYEEEGNTKSSVKDRLAKFFIDFFTKDFSMQDLVLGIQKLKKRSLFDFIINLLNRILIHKKYNDLQEMINQEIYKLQLELSEEIDYELRKILELRILMLAELKSSILFIHENPLLLDFLGVNVILANLKEVSLKSTIDQKSEFTSQNLSLYLERTLCSLKIVNLRFQQNPSLYTQKIHLSNESFNHENILVNTHRKLNDKIKKFENHNNLSIHISSREHKQSVLILQFVSLVLIVAGVVSQYLKNIEPCTQKLNRTQEKDHKISMREKVTGCSKNPDLLGVIMLLALLYVRGEKNNQKERIEPQEKNTSFSDMIKRGRSEISI